MQRIKELERQYINKEINKTDFYWEAARILSGLYGEEYEEANRELVSFSNQSDIGHIGLGKIFRKSREMRNR